MASFIRSVRNNRSVSPVAQRLLELCVHYQQQEQNNQNDLTLSSVNGNDMNEQLKKRIKYLLKKIKKSRRNGSIEEFEHAILHRDSRTRCFTIPRSVDTTQEQSSKSNLVVESCRLWRWPNLCNQNELKPVDYCQYPFHYKPDSICINPFHYERVPSMYSVNVPRLPPGTVRNRPDIHLLSTNDMTSNQIPQNETYQVPFQQQQQQQRQELSPSSLSPESINSQDSSLSPSVGLNNDENMETTIPMEFDSILSTLSNTTTEQNLSCERVAFEELREWCHISYYEMSNRIGEQFRATQSQVTIDGFTHPSSADRFCLGGLTNVQRTMEIDKARRYIGRGVKLFHVRGNVFAECLSDNPVFVQSPVANRRFSWHPATVCKIPPTVRFQIFDSDDFTKILSSAVDEGYETVYNLMKMCIIRMSLVKGWGVEYGRPAVTCTPCWIEIHLDGPLKWLDTVLSTMQGPTQSITSVSL